MPACAVTTIVDCPGVAAADEVTFKATLPEAVTEDDGSEPVALPLVVTAESVTGPLNPVARVTLTCPAVDPPGTMEVSVLPAPSVNGAVIVNVTAALAESVPPASVPVNWMVPPLVTPTGIVAIKLAVVEPAGTVTLPGVMMTPLTPLVGATTTAPLKPLLGVTVTTIGTVCPEKPAAEPPLRVKGTVPRPMLPEADTAMEPP